MSSVAEIESAIEQLLPQDFRALHEWMAKRVERSSWRKWGPDELEEGARRMVEEPDPARAEEIKQEIMRGFFGTANA